MPAGDAHTADLQPPLDEAREDELRERAQRLLTRRSLIAFDLDKTVLHQGHHSELQTFTTSVCQTLIQLAAQRYNISAVTGNDLHQLSSRFMKAFVEELCRHQQLQLLSVMHLFCNCATVYICFSLDSPVLAALLRKQASLAPISPPYLTHISPTSRLHLAYISPISRRAPQQAGEPRAYISPISPPHLAYNSPTSRLSKQASLAPQQLQEAALEALFHAVG